MPRSHDHVLITRRQVLQALRLASPATMTTDELLQGIPLVGQDSESAAAFRETLQDLAGWGYIENLHPGQTREPWWRITGTGREQITQEAEKLDLKIWGKLAL